MKPVIELTGVGKKYRLGQAESEDHTLIGSLVQLAKAPLRNFQRIKNLSSLDRLQDSVFWALRDISFSVQPGEVLGIIGHNGAGKSTLLKILSRITDPSEGEIVIRGRVASLLEVGTGFHPELTGRENVYMNGTILGMTRKEIDRKFDEIVDFSGVEKHIDTPVKFYSSGMKVRLGFAVAAHLEPEILIVDEVLAVGDIGFQRKCLGKMGDVARSGRTILFVSHQMAAIQALCTRALLLHQGKTAHDGLVADTVRAYLAEFEPEVSGFLLSGASRQGSGLVQITDFGIHDEAGVLLPAVPCGSQLRLWFKLANTTGRVVENIDIGFSLHSTEDDSLLTILYSSYSGNLFTLIEKECTVSCVIDRLPLPEGRYLVKAQVMQNGEVLDFPVKGAGYLDVTGGDFYGTGATATRLTRSKPAFLVNGDWKQV